MKIWVLTAKNDGDTAVHLGLTRMAARQDYMACCLELYNEDPEEAEDATNWGFDEWVEFTGDTVDEWEQEVATI